MGGLYPLKGCNESIVLFFIGVFSHLCCQDGKASMIIMDIFYETMLTSNMMMWKSLRALALQLHGNWYRAGQQGRGTCYSARAKGAHGTVHGQEGHCISRYSIRAAWAHGTEGWSILYIAVQYRGGRAHCKECRGWSTMYIAVQYMGHTVMATPPT